MFQFVCLQKMFGVCFFGVDEWRVGLRVTSKRATKCRNISFWHVLFVSQSVRACEENS